MIKLANFRNVQVQTLSTNNKAYFQDGGKLESIFIAVKGEQKKTI